MISPAGTVVWTYDKTYPVVPGESADTVRGSGVLPVADTPYGRLTTAICYDLEYPGLLRQAGQKGADILLAPNNEPYSFQASYRAGEQVYRAIENGTSLIRPDGDGISLMTDYLGRVIASQNYSASNDGIMLASVPTHGVSTIYSHIGDAFAYLCTIGLVLESTWPGAPSATPPGQARQPKTTPFPGPSHHRRDDAGGDGDGYQAR